MTSLTPGFDAADARGPAPETPGICGISDLKRSDGGWSVMGLRFDSIPETAGSEDEGRAE